MKVFVSSLIAGMEAHRAAVKRAIVALGHEPIMAERFGALPTSPQIACLQGIRDADLVVLVLGRRYGTQQPSGLSATHEEFREAFGRKEILVFTEEGVPPEPAQRAFIEETGAWDKGLFRAAFRTPEELGDGVSGALHRWELAHTAAPINFQAMGERALSLLPANRSSYTTSGATLALAVAPGPSQSVLRPADIEKPGLAEAFEQEGLYGTHRIFEQKYGFEATPREAALVIAQQGQHDRFRCQLMIHETGDLLIQQALISANGRASSNIIQEDIERRLRAMVGYSAWLLDEIDSTHRLTHAALAARLSGSSVWGWRTQAEDAANPNGGTVSIGREEEREEPVVLAPAYRIRAALSMDSARIAEDLMVLLRRRWKLQ